MLALLLLQLTLLSEGGAAGKRRSLPPRPGLQRRTRYTQRYLPCPCQKSAALVALVA